MLNRFPFIRQFDASDCAVACVRMLCKYYHVEDYFDNNEYYLYTSNNGTSLEGVLEIARLCKFSAVCGKTTINNLIEQFDQPCILYWNGNHYVILYKIFNTKRVTKFYISDPARGKVKLSYQEFVDLWGMDNNDYTVENDEISGIVILIERQDQKQNVCVRKSFYDSSISIIPFIKKDKRLFLFLIIGTIIGCCIQLIFPFLTQSIVDKGISNQNIKIVILILIGQFLLITGNLVNDYFRKWITLKFSYKFSKNLFSCIINKLLHLPIRFFDSKSIGDFLQRFQDHEKVEKFITTHVVNFTFSIISLCVLSCVLMTFDMMMFGIFIFGSALYVLWSIFFIQKKKMINQQMFSLKSKNQNRYHDIIKGIADIKLQNYGKTHINKIEEIQNDIYVNNINNLKVEQKIESGNIFINEFKNLLITFISAYLVIDNTISIGSMLSIQYIIGQLNVPINQLIVFINNYPDASLSLHRLNDILIKKEAQLGHEIPASNKDIVVRNLSFKYVLTDCETIQNINISIPAGKTTAIVGASGSGKTTFVKLLLKLYEPISGDILYGNTPLNIINTEQWHEICGSVLQDGYIFSDTILKNITMDRPYDKNKLNDAVKIANIQSFIESLYNGYDTIIGDEGVNLSQGQKQRILIARAVYKNPMILFFDEATNSLDTKNENKIVTSLYSYLKNRTAIIVAHRLSTVKFADLILVMKNGSIVEKGTHEELLKKKGYYFELIENQL